MLRVAHAQARHEASALQVRGRYESRLDRQAGTPQGGRGGGLSPDPHIYIYTPRSHNFQIQRRPPLSHPLEAAVPRIYPGVKAVAAGDTVRLTYKGHSRMVCIKVARNSVETADLLDPVIHDLKKDHGPKRS